MWGPQWRTSVKQVCSDKEASICCMYMSSSGAAAFTSDVGYHKEVIHFTCVAPAASALRATKIAISVGLRESQHEARKTKPQRCALNHELACRANRSHLPDAEHDTTAHSQPVPLSNHRIPFSLNRPHETALQPSLTLPSATELHVRDKTGRLALIQTCQLQHTLSACRLAPFQCMTQEWTR